MKLEIGEVIKCAKFSNMLYGIIYSNNKYSPSKVDRNNLRFPSYGESRKVETTYKEKVGEWEREKEYSLDFDATDSTRGEAEFVVVERFYEEGGIGQGGDSFFGCDGVILIRLKEDGTYNPDGERIKLLLDESLDLKIVRKMKRTFI